MVTLRHFNAAGEEVYYTGTAGDPVPLCKGFLRASLRAIDDKHPSHRDYLPYRSYLRNSESFLDADTPYSLLVEVWPTNCVFEKGSKLVFEVSPALPRPWFYADCCFC